MEYTYTGTIHLIIGPMWAGKTSELIRLKRRSDLIGRKTLCIKYFNDCRYSDENINTHDGVSYPAIKSTGKSLKETIKNINNVLNYDDVFIDEIQFYDDACEICEMLANCGINVIVCGLQGDFNRNGFKSVIELLPKADKITHLTAIDKKDGNDCAFTKRLNTDEKIEVIGGKDIYEACNRKNYFK